jgi:hypothetical protein
MARTLEIKKIMNDRPIENFLIKMMPIIVIRSENIKITIKNAFKLLFTILISIFIHELSIIIGPTTKRKNKYTVSNRTILNVIETTKPAKIQKAPKKRK